VEWDWKRADAVRERASLLPMRRNGGGHGNRDARKKWRYRFNVEIEDNSIRTSEA
jgi:hypothetical protein